MPPVNISFATAIDLGTLPVDITQNDINDAGVNYTVYYKFTAPANSRVIGAWGFSGNIVTGYRPSCNPYLGPAGSPTSVLSISSRKPIQFPVTPGNEYFLEFSKNVDSAGPEELRVRVEVAPLTTIQRGNIAVNDDTPGFPLAILSHTADNTVINFVKGIAAGEQADVLEGNTMCIEDRNDNTVKLYDSGYAQTYVSSVLSGTIKIRRSGDRSKFYIGLSKNPVEVATLTGAGVLSAFFTLTGEPHIECLCADETESILYFANLGAGVAIKRWDIPGNAAMADFAAGVATYQITDILVQTDGSILAMYNQLSAPNDDTYVVRFNAAGTVLNTYMLGDLQGAGAIKPRLAYALDDPNSFWAWNHPGDGTSAFRNVKCSDGTVLTTRIQREYEGGAMQGAETATPSSRFGNSFSCPFWIVPLGGGGGIIVIIKDKRTDTNGIIDVAIPNPTFKTALIP